jgi:hypothetical protein
MILLLGLIAGFILGLKAGITLGHRAERRARRLAALELLDPKGDLRRLSD